METDRNLLPSPSSKRIRNPPGFVRVLVQIAHGDIPGISPPQSEPTTLWQDYWPLFGGIIAAFVTLVQLILEGESKVDLWSGIAYIIVSSIGIAALVYIGILIITIAIISPLNFLRAKFGRIVWLFLVIVLLVALFGR